MSVVTWLWASVQGDPVFMRRVNGWLTIFWVLMIPPSIVTVGSTASPMSRLYALGTRLRSLVRPAGGPS
jgi:hypothetical protein